MRPNTAAHSPGRRGSPVPRVCGRWLGPLPAQAPEEQAPVGPGSGWPLLPSIDYSSRWVLGCKVRASFPPVFRTFGLLVWRGAYALDF
jgi:hypothetical protein